MSISWEERVQQEVHCASYESLWVTPHSLPRALISLKSSLFSIDSTPVSLCSKYAPVGLISTVLNTHVILNNAQVNLFTRDTTNSGHNKFNLLWPDMIICLIHHLCINIEQH